MRWRWMAGGAALFLAACANGAEPEPDPWRVVAPPSVTVFAGDSVPVTAQAEDSLGHVLSAPVRYRSRDPAIAAVSADGVVHGLAHGTVLIEEESGNASATTVVLVTLGGFVGPAGGAIAPPGDRVRLVVPPGALPVTTELELEPLTGAEGQEVLPGTGYVVGPADIVFRRPARLFVRYDTGDLPAGAEMSAGLFERQASGWVAVQGSGADVSAMTASGPVAHAGRYGVQAPGNVASLTIDPASVLVLIGTRQPFTCTLLNAQGQSLSNRPIAWSSSDTSVMQVTDSGVATPVGLGPVQIVASSGGASGTAQATGVLFCFCPPASSAPIGTPGCACGPSAARR